MKNSEDKKVMDKAIIIFKLCILNNKSFIYDLTNCCICIVIQQQNHSKTFLFFYKLLLHAK